MMSGAEIYRSSNIWKINQLLQDRRSALIKQYVSDTLLGRETASCPKALRLHSCSQAFCVSNALWTLIWQSIWCMFIYNETAAVVTHFDSLSLKLTVELAPTSCTICTIQCVTKSHFIILMLTPAPSQVLTRGLFSVVKCAWAHAVCALCFFFCVCTPEVVVNVSRTTDFNHLLWKTYSRIYFLLSGQTWPGNMVWVFVYRHEKFDFSCTQHHRRLFWCCSNIQQCGNSRRDQICKRGKASGCIGVIMLPQVLVSGFINIQEV